MNDREHYEHMQSRGYPFAILEYKATPSEQLEMERLLRVGTARACQIDAERLRLTVMRTTWMRPTGVGKVQDWIQKSLNRWRADTVEVLLDKHSLVVTFSREPALDKQVHLAVRGQMLSTRLHVRPDVRQSFAF